MTKMFGATSLHRRLSIAVAVLAAFVGVLGAFGTFLVVSSLATEFDSSLRDVAAHVRSGALDGTAPRTAAPRRPEDLIVQIWSAADGARPSKLSDPNVILPKGAPGFSSLSFQGERWDVFALQAANEYIQIAELRSVRTRNAIRVAFWTLLPVLALLPLLVLTIVITVRMSLRPLDRIGRRAAQIDLNNLQALDAKAAPDELRPFLDSINRMIERLSVLVNAERQFIANAAHELRSPLSAMQLQMDNLRNAPAAEREERLDALQRGIWRTSSLVSQLLGLARAEIGGTMKSLGDVSLPQLVSDVIADLLPLAADRGVDVGVVVLDKVSVRAVEADLRVLVKNLVDNAIRYAGTDAHVDVSVYQRPGKVLIEVMDNGPGITSADLEHVFERFFRAGVSDEEGSGLGLSISQALAANYGGRVLLSKRADGGSGLVAIIELPLK